jgi:hypothetical protein
VEKGKTARIFAKTDATINLNRSLPTFLVVDPENPESELVLGCHILRHEKKASCLQEAFLCCAKFVLEILKKDRIN